MTVPTIRGERTGPLGTGSVVLTETSDEPCVIWRWLGGGSQGDVYEAGLRGTPVAVKWYRPEWSSPSQFDGLHALVRRPAPSPAFLWPIDVVRAPGLAGFGYVMPLRDRRFRPMADVVTRRAEPTFRTLMTAAMWLAHNFLMLHAEGMCYRDISFGNVFLDPCSGDVLVCDNDNVGIDGAVDNPLLGTPRFMAPEVVRGTGLPNSTTDLHSLAVLLFYLLVFAHPLEPLGANPPATFDLEAMRSVYGSHPTFVFETDPMGSGPGALWRVYPELIRAEFRKTFTVGLADPGARTREGEWRDGFACVRDLLVYCGTCGAENFVELRDGEPVPVTPGCWRCGCPVTPPLRLELNGDVVMLNHDGALFAHHLDPGRRRWEFSRPLAAVVQHPSDPRRWGLRNDSSQAWGADLRNGAHLVIAPGDSMPLVVGTAVDFGFVRGVVRGNVFDQEGGQGHA